MKPTISNADEPLPEYEPHQRLMPESSATKTPMMMNVLRLFAAIAEYMFPLLA
jgi:hypothetical protein